MEADTTASDPWSGLAWYFHADLKSWLPIGIALTPIEIAAVLICVFWAFRGPRTRRFTFERGILFWPIIGLAGLLIYGFVWGSFQSGSDPTVGLWEIRSLSLAILAYFLVGILFTHRHDLETLTWAILISTALLAFEDIIRYYVFLGRVVGDLDYDHEDATMLAFAILLSVAILLLGGTKRQKRFAMICIPLDAIALEVTHRRVGFGALAFAIVFLVVIFYRANRRLFMRIIPISALLMSLYLAAYWNCSGGNLCQPARALTSQINPDPRDASSNLYRFMEEQDLILNIKANPITGRGFGNTFLFYIPLPDLSFWPFWHYTSHDAILWIWVKTGMFGFVLFWWLVGSGLYRGGRLVQALHVAGDDNTLSVLAAATCLIPMQVAASYVDLGLTSDRAMLLFGVMLGVIGHLPGILRRTTHTDRIEPANREVSAVLDAEMPEVQVGVLSHVLIASADEPSSDRRAPTHSRPQTGRRVESRWGQPDTSEPLLTTSPKARRQTPNGRTGVQTTPQEDSFDDLPWTN